MKTNKNNSPKRNNVGTANLNPAVGTVDAMYTDYQNYIFQAKQSRNALRQATADLIESVKDRLEDKLKAKVPYIVRRKARRQNGNRRQLQAFVANRVLAITERGVIFRVCVKMEGWFPMNIALELSHDQIAMNDADWKNYLGSYAGFIGKTYNNWVDPKATAPAVTDGNDVNADENAQ